MAGRKPCPDPAPATTSWWRSASDCPRTPESRRSCNGPDPRPHDGTLCQRLLLQPDPRLLWPWTLKGERTQISSGPWRVLPWATGCGKGTCGSLAGGACLIALYAGKGRDEEDENELLWDMLGELWRWFDDTMGPLYGGVRCDDILADGAPRAQRCGPIVAQTYAKAMEILHGERLRPHRGTGVSEALSLTESVCPVCLKKVERGPDDHGRRGGHRGPLRGARSVADADLARPAFLPEWGALGRGRMPDGRAASNADRPDGRRLPHGSAVCARDHQQHTCTAVVEVTRRCNLRVPRVFAESTPDARCTRSKHPDELEGAAARALLDVGPGQRAALRRRAHHARRSAGRHRQSRRSRIHVPAAQHQRPAPGGGTAGTRRLCEKPGSIRSFCSSTAWQIEPGAASADGHFSRRSGRPWIAARLPAWRSCWFPPWCPE